MQRKTYILTLLTLVVSLLAAGGCAGPGAAVTPSGTGLKDQLGRTVQVEKAPQRIISLAPSQTEILFALGLGDKVVGVTDYCSYPPEAKQKPSIGGYSNPNLEKIVSLSPDLILADPIQEKEVIPALEARGLTVFALAPKTISGVLEAIGLVGQVTGNDKEASRLAADMEGKIKAITDKTSKVPEAQKPRVFYVVWHDPLMAAGSGTMIDEFIRTSGGINIAANLKSYANISLEAVIQANPQVIIAGTGMGEGADASLQFVKSEPRLKDIDARRQDRIYAVNTELVGRGGPRITEALEKFATAMYPELFGKAK